MINRFFLKKFEFNAVILLQFGDWGDMPKVFLRNVVIIEVQILLQGGFQMPGGGESGGFQYLGDATVKALDHAVGLRVLGLDQSVLDIMRGANLVEDVLAGGLALAGGAKAVGELFPVVGQHGTNAERCLGTQAFQEAGGGGGRFYSAESRSRPSGWPGQWRRSDRGVRPCPASGAGLWGPHVQTPVRRP